MDWSFGGGVTQLHKTQFHPKSTPLASAYCLLDYRCVQVSQRWTDKIRRKVERVLFSLTGTTVCGRRSKQPRKSISNAELD